MLEARLAKGEVCLVALGLAYRKCRKGKPMCRIYEIWSKGGLAEKVVRICAWETREHAPAWATRPVLGPTHWAFQRQSQLGAWWEQSRPDAV